ncbi:MAG TPA: ferritin-like domain-containing protein [Chthoniobacterales bacterium]
MNLPSHQKAKNEVDLDRAILTFALNLEYLEAEYYLRGTTGLGVDAQIGGATNPQGSDSVTVKPNPKVPFVTRFFQDVSAEIAQDELNHVRFFRKALGGSVVARPAIDLLNSFNSLAQVAGLGQGFDPFANETNFLIGAFIFEDVGVSAFRGAAPLITNKDYLGNAAGILAVEAYHAGIIRSLLYGLGSHAQNFANQISAIRSALSGDGPEITDQGFELNGKPNFVPADANSSAFGRSDRQVLNIVYGGPNTTRGLFFPNGLDGPIH